MNELKAAKIMLILTKVAETCSFAKKLLKVQKIFQKAAERNMSMPSHHPTYILTVVFYACLEYMPQFSKSTTNLLFTLAYSVLQWRNLLCRR